MTGYFYHYNNRFLSVPAVDEHMIMWEGAVDRLRIVPSNGTDEVSIVWRGEHYTDVTFCESDPGGRAAATNRTAIHQDAAIVH
jgi:hypothetical protein